MPASDWAIVRANEAAERDSTTLRWPPFCYVIWSASGSQSMGLRFSARGHGLNTHPEFAEPVKRLLNSPNCLAVHIRTSSQRFRRRTNWYFASGALAARFGQLNQRLGFREPDRKGLVHDGVFARQKRRAGKRSMGIVRTCNDY